MQEVAELLDRLDALGAARERVSIDDVRDLLGHDAFGPALLTLGLLALSPIGDIPGTPTMMSVMIVAVGTQMAAGRRAFWLPNRLARRTVKGRHLSRAARFLRPAVRFLSRFIRARWSVLTTGPFARAIGGICAALALTLPPLEFVPFGATVPSTVITCLAVALVARDGILALIALALLIGGGVLIGTLVR